MRVIVVRYSPHFKRSFKKLPHAIRIQALGREKIFRSNPFDPQLKTHKLSGKMEGLWAFSVTQKYRVVFFFKTDVEVGFTEIGDHTIYR